MVLFINNQTAPTIVSTIDTSRNFQLSDVGLFLVTTGNAIITVTLPINTWEPNTELYLAHNSDAIVSIIASSGVTITRFGGTNHQLAGKGSLAILKLISSNNWLLFGDFF